MSQFLLYNGSYAFTMFTDQSMEKTINSLGSLNIAFNSDVVLFARGKMYDIYRASPGRAMIVTEIGNWSQSGQVTMRIF